MSNKYNNRDNGGNRSNYNNSDVRSQNDGPQRNPGESYNGLTTVSGLLARRDEAPFTIATVEVKKFIQNRIDGMMQKLNEQGVETDARTELEVISMKFSRKFAPFIITFPESMLIMPREKEDRVEAFKTENSDQVRLMTAVYKAIQPWMYTRRDRKEFYSKSFRTNCGLDNLNNIRVLYNYTVPKFVTRKGQDGERSREATLIIDPVRVFMSMLVDYNKKNEKFEIWIKGYDMLNDINFRYDVLRQVVRRRKDSLQTNVQAYFNYDGKRH